MPQWDLNLLLALDALLAEGSVVGAARRMHLSPSAMSRTLARLRESLGDPILVRAGGKLVPTPRAQSLRERVRALLEEAQGVFRSAQVLDLGRLSRAFTIRANDGFLEQFAGELVAHVARQAPGVRLRFAPKSDKDVAALRESHVDLDVGIVTETGPEIRVQTLFHDRYIGVVRAGHPLQRGKVTPERFASYPHVMFSRRGRQRGLIDQALEELGLSRSVVSTAPSFSVALAIARASDLVASVPERQATRSRAGMFAFELPVRTEELVMSQMWHPRADADPAHRWLRQCLREVCAAPSATP